MREHLEEVPGSGFSSSLETEYTYGTDLLDSVFDPRDVRRTYRHDAAGRLIAEGDEAGVEETYSLDAGGLVTSAVTRRGATITHAYDLVGRRIKTFWPSVDGFLADSLRLTYDAMGQLTRAEAEGRAVARFWYPTGAIKRDSSNLVMDYAYDAAGRRDWYRIGLSTAVNRDSVVYRYDPVTGALATIAVRWWGQTDISDSVQFRWDSLGRRDTLLYSNGARALHMYDEDGALRVLCGSHPNPPTAPQPSVFNFAVVHTWVDGEGQIRRTDTGQPGIGGCGATYFQPVGPSQDNTYDARHQLIRDVSGSHDWTYVYDGSANRVSHVYNGESWQYTYDAGSNRLVSRSKVGGGETWEYQYWPDGARATESPCGAERPCPGSRDYSYDGLGRTRRTEEHACDHWDPDSNECIGWGNQVSTVECGYDPLGRQVMTCENAGPWLGYDGDRVVRTDPQSTSYFWTFVHAEGVDDPVLGRYTQNQSFGQTYFFVTDGQGRQYAVGRADGSDGRQEENYTLRGGRLSGAGEIATSFGAQRLPSTSQPGLAFFRNRFYDQQTGRWTHEDPIGVAGGVNLYGFVGNNPVTFTDPFGLCPEDKGGDGKTDRLDDCPEGSEGWKEYQKAQEAERAAVQQCYEQNKFSSAMGSLSGSQGVAKAVDVAESVSLISVGADIVAMGFKAMRSGIGGTSNPYASGMNMVGRPIARAIGRAISGDPAVTGKLVGGVTAVGDKVSPTLLLIAAGTAAYNTATDLQCRVGIIK